MKKPFAQAFALRVAPLLSGSALLLTGSALILSGSAALAQTYPSRPVSFCV